MRRATCFVVSIAFAVLPLVSDAQSPPPERGPGPLPTAEGGVEQLARNKEAMVARLLGDSPLARRILESNHPPAIALYRDAQQRFGEARTLLAAGSAAQANEGFDVAMQAMHQARKLLPDTIGGDAELQVRFGGLLKSLESLRKSYKERFFVDVPAGKGAPAEAEKQLAAIDVIIGTARQDASAGRIADGVARLQKAERMLMVALQEAIGSDTVEYRKQGRSPEQIYRDELGRNQSFVELVPVALNHLNPGPDRAAALQRQVQLSAEARSRAERTAAARDYGAAAEILQQATTAIEDLLRDAGLAIPRDSRD